MRVWKILYIIQILIIFSLILAFVSFSNRKFRIIACDVGQGDAILATYGNLQILTDGGPDSKVLDCLGKHMPYWDKTIELVVLTHPDSDHFTGLIDVLQRYEVIIFLKTKATNSSQSYQLLESLVGGSNINIIYADSVRDIRLGKIYLDILSPFDSNQILEDESNINNSSIVSMLKYGNFEALLTGDIEIEGINKIIREGMVKDVEYIKIPHHGSANNTTSSLLRFSSPEIAVISVGKNSYGHPNKEVLELLKKYNISKVYITQRDGDVIVESDGENFWVTQ